MYNLLKIKIDFVYICRYVTLYCIVLYWQTVAINVFNIFCFLHSIHSTSTDRRWAMSHLNTPPVRKRSPLTARSSSLRGVSAAEHHTAKQYSKTGWTKPRKHLPRSDLSWNTYQDLLKIASLWQTALETERIWFSKVILKSNVTPNITRSSDSFSKVPPIAS